MNTFSGLNGGIDGRNNFNDIDDNYQKDISDIVIGYFRFMQNYGDGPPETHGIEKEDENLGYQCLHPMPSYKFGGSFFAHNKDDGGQ